MADTWTTVGVAVDAGAELIASAGIESPRRIALRLWRELGHAPTMDATVHRDLELDEMEAAKFLEAARRLAAGEPMQYVTGSAGFRRLVLRADARALIPRPETEGLVGAALSRVREGCAADIGTGTGAIALSLRDEGAFDTVVGVDISAAALALACDNGRTTGHAVRWVRGDLTRPLAHGSFDLLVSNPPYLTALEGEELDVSVAGHEPRLALVSGADGLEATRRLLIEGRDVLKPGGWIAVELDSRRATASAAIATAAGWIDVEVQDDLFGRARFLLARREMQQ